MANTPNIQQMPCSRRYFIAYPHHPTHWEELSKDEYRACLAAATLGAPDAEGVRLVSLPAEMVPAHPCPLPLMGALFTLLTLPYTGGL